MGVSWWGHKVDNGYWLWSFQGKILKRIQLDRFCQLLWRPRPPTLLTQKDIKEIKKNLKKYSVEFDVVDREQGSKKSKELLTRRRNFYEEFLINAYFVLDIEIAFTCRLVNVYLIS